MELLDLGVDRVARSPTVDHPERLIGAQHRELDP
jgi:hypothetical protein